MSCWTEAFLYRQSHALRPLSRHTTKVSLHVTGKNFDVLSHARPCCLATSHTSRGLTHLWYVYQNETHGTGHTTPPISQCARSQVEPEFGRTCTHQDANRPNLRTGH